jgi:hypothetical protein
VPLHQFTSPPSLSKHQQFANLKETLKETYSVVQRDAEVAVEDQQASKGGFATPEVPWRSRTKPASAPDRAVSRMAPTSTMRRSAPR